MKKEIVDLQDQLAYIDLKSRQGLVDIIEILIKKILHLEFRMEPDHHGAPHVHIIYGRAKHVASYRINDGVRVAGVLDNKYDSTVRNWISKNQEKSKQIWDEMKAGNQNQYEFLIGQL